MRKPAPPPVKSVGRPPLDDAGTIRTTVRMTQAQHEKLGRLGGSQWIRDMIDKARERNQ